MTIKLLLFITLFALLPHAQQDTPSIIDADNVEQLQSMLRLDFREVAALGLTPGSGLFVTNQDASLIVTFANAGGESPLSTAVLWDGFTGEILDSVFIGENSFDRALSPDGSQLVIATRAGMRVLALPSGEEIALYAPEATFLDVWIDADGTVCGETMPPTGVIYGEIICDDDAPIPLFPDDEDAAVRIGRVPGPLAITGNEDGGVKRWDLETATVTAAAQADEIVIFGGVNVDGWPSEGDSGSHLAWRDGPSTQLSLIDFETGASRPIAELDGGFIAYILLTRQADVILAVDSMSQRGEVWAWDVETTEFMNLGAYRTCNRIQPDLAALSPDGTTLIIGCDLGLDIWRN